MDREPSKRKKMKARASKDRKSAPTYAEDFEPSEEDRAWAMEFYKQTYPEARVTFSKRAFNKKEKWYNTKKFVWVAVTIWVGTILFFSYEVPDRFRHDDSETRSDISIQKSQIDDLKREVDRLENKVFDLEQEVESNSREIWFLQPG